MINRNNRDNKKAVFYLAGISLLILVIMGFFFMKHGGKNDEITDTEDTSYLELTDKEENIPDQEELTETEEPISEEERLAQEVEEKLNSMTLEERVAQLFIITPEALTGYGSVTQAGETTHTALTNYPVGGIIYFENNVVSEQQVMDMTSLQQQYSKERIGLPLFMAIDEEGGKVTRIASCDGIDVPQFSYISEIGATQNVSKAYEVGDTIGTYLSRLGFNLDFAPDADVLSNPSNSVVKYRSFGSDPNLVSDMVINQLDGLQTHGVYGCAKHFPGHGATTGDTHKGYAYVDKSWDQIVGNEVVPFQKCIDHGIKFVMVGHISMPQVTGDDTPASLSKVLITDYLKNTMGFHGIVLTDALQMKAVTDQYSSSDAAIKAVNAGVDMLLMPKDFHSAYDGLLSAVQSGTISEDRINESVRKILEIKLTMEKK